MTVASEEDKRRELLPEHEVLRAVECLEGEVEVEVVFDPRPDYGGGCRRSAPAGGGDYVGERATSSCCAARSTSPPTRPRPLRPRAPRPPASGAPLLSPPTAATRRSCRRSATPPWPPRPHPPLVGGVGRALPLRGAARGGVVRSALALRLLLYAPSGAFVAAPTTSLPESPGGIRNWDYRYCWLRDASWTLEALLDLGYEEEAHGLLLLAPPRHPPPPPRAARRLRPARRGGAGRARAGAPRGLRGARPVRVGNGGQAQLQLDIFGEVVDTAYQFVARGGTLDGAQGRLLAAVGEAVCRPGASPTRASGSSAPAPATTPSRRRCAGWRSTGWSSCRARAGAPAGRGLPARARRDPCRDREPRLERAARQLRRRAGRRGAGRRLLLLGSTASRRPARRACGRRWRVEERLGGGGLLYRYPMGRDGLPPHEGAFGVCGFWAVELLARAGETAAAEERLARLVGYGNDVGLFAEEIDPATGAALGNFPQAFTHLGLINAALALQEIGQ